MASEFGGGAGASLPSALGPCESMVVADCDGPDRAGARDAGEGGRPVSPGAHKPDLPLTLDPGERLGHVGNDPEVTDGPR